MVLAGQAGDGALSASYFLNIWEFLEGRLLHLMCHLAVTITLRRKHQTRASRDFFSPLLALMAPLEHPQHLYNEEAQYICFKSTGV